MFSVEIQNFEPLDRLTSILPDMNLQKTLSEILKQINNNTCNNIDFI